MQIQETPKPTRRRPTLRLFAAGLLALIVAIASSGLVAFGAFHNNGADGLAAVGPLGNETGFPVWFKDTTGKRLELCLDIDTHCLLASADVPSPGEPLSVRTGNFPGEAFWFAADSFIELPGGLDGALVLALEAAFATGEVPLWGDQVTFGRLRIRITGLQPNTEYTITHPYGSNTIAADAEGEINFTEDIGFDAPGVAALSSRIGPFLTALSPPAPEGYIGSPGVEQTVTGSPYSTNYFMIEGPGVRAAGDPGACPNRGADLTCAYTDLFALSGKYATNAGVDLNTVLYSRDGAGNTTLNIYASSEADQSIQVDGPDFYVTSTTANGGNYYARVDLGNKAPGGEVVVTNLSDTPPVSKRGTAIDIVTISRAEYDTATRTLTVDAASSDLFSNPALTLDGFNQALSGGSLAITNLDAPPMYATVRSAAGGWDTEQVRVIGPGYAPMPVVANPGTVQTVVQGQAVALDGTQSLGEIETWQWTQVSNGAPPVTLSNATGAVATFVAPDNPGDTNMVLRFRLTVGNALTSNSAFVNVRVRPASALPVARAGADQNVLRGTAVTVDGSASANALSYSWAQVSGPTVIPAGETRGGAQFTFTYPQAVGTVVLELTASGPGGVDTDRVRIVPFVDSVTIASAQHRDGEWRVRGTAGAFAGNIVYIYRGTTCPVGGGANTNLIGSIAVDALGGWDYRAAGTSSTRVSVCTLGGARQLNFVARVR